MTIKHYHADNGRFADNLWLADITTQGQSISFCGVGAHFQNGIAEKRIRDLTESARTMMLQAADKWPKAISVSLWPYAIRSANEVLNCTPRTDNDRQAPIEIFSRTPVRPNLRHFHHFGCPTYVLRARLQTAGGSVGKWNTKARIGINLGTSPRHARSVALVLNPRTGLVSPQWHCKFDDMFETVSASRPDNSHGYWKRLTDFLKVEQEAKQDTPTIQTADILSAYEQEPSKIPISEGANVTDEKQIEQDKTLPQVPQDIGTPITPEDDPSKPAPRRSPRIKAQMEKVYQAQQQDPMAFSSNVEVGNEIYDQPFESVGMTDPIAFAATKSDPDTMYYHQAMKQEDSDKFRLAMKKEIDDHVERDNWQLMLRSNIPEGTKVLSSVWSMKRKRRIKTREIYKWKARLNVHGGQQIEGIHYWDTYSPVVTWLSIRLVLILSIIFDWHTRQIDFVLAFPQAPVETPLYMEIPVGTYLSGVVNSKDYVLLLKKNLYGQKQAGRVWNKYLHEGLIEIGFKQSKVDECVYYKGTTIFLVYVDDGILAGPSAEEIDDIIKALEKRYDVTDEGDITDYLGVNVEKLPDGRVKLSQPHLIDQIISDMNFQESTKMSATPAASTKILNKDEQGEAHSASWSYRSIIGKLNFLEKSTRGELAYAVHQAARFCEQPKKSHTEAVNKIVRYLIGTRNEGIYLNPKGDLFECFADADFCGLWDKERSDFDPSVARSRTGYVIRFAGCPLIWGSRLQEMFALSSTESEYMSLSTALRDVIPLMELLKEFKNYGIVSKEYCPVVKCKAFEDNSGALEMARTHKMRPRTKHISVKFHHFRSYVANHSITVAAIDTLQQLADLWTKPLGSELFNKFTEEVFGWSVPEAQAKHRASMGRGSVMKLDESIKTYPAVSPDSKSEKRMCNVSQLTRETSKVTLKPCIKPIQDRRFSKVHFDLQSLKIKPSLSKTHETKYSIVSKPKAHAESKTEMSRYHR